MIQRFGHRTDAITFPILGASRRQNWKHSRKVSKNSFNTVIRNLYLLTLLLVIKTMLTLKCFFIFYLKDPLQLGEQYYCDLAGNIRIGQVGIGNTCYCGPFFNHIEQKINQNKKCFKKYVIKAKHDSKGHDEKIHRIARWAWHHSDNQISIDN